MRLSKEARVPELTEGIRKELEKRSCVLYRNNTIWCNTRARIILLAAEDVPIKVICEKVSLSRNRVADWRDRFMKHLPFLKSVEQNEPELLPDYIELALSDNLKSGRPMAFNFEQLTLIMKVACNNPRDYDIERSHWSLSSLRRTVIKLEIVKDISEATLCRFLNSVGVRPHKNRYWLHSSEKDEDPVGYKLKVQALNQIYFTAQIIAQMGGEADLRIISADEMTGVQSLEHKYARKFAAPGMDPRQEFEYIRHGTLAYIGFFDVVTGRVFKPYMSKTHKEYDFVEALAEVIDSDPDSDRRWIIIVDNFNTHSSEALVQYIAKEIGYTGDLGEKGKYGILKNVQTRKEFLTDRSHRICIVYTPKHSSWLNQIEIFFGHLQRDLLRRSSYMTKDELKASIERYIEQHNRYAHPYRWLYDTTPVGSYDIWYIPPRRDEPINYEKAVSERKTRSKSRRPGKGRSKRRSKSLPVPA